MELKYNWHYGQIVAGMIVGFISFLIFIVKALLAG
jgi:hypothetical protein